MRVLIVEDEAPAARRLQTLLIENDPLIEVVGVIDSIEDTAQWLKESLHPDLIFMDIMLADGQSFEIFEQVNVEVPVIFTTAYDEYAIKAFKVNSIDYLLKPLDPILLNQALNKYRRLSQPLVNLKEAVESLIKVRVKDQEPHLIFKNRFLVKSGDKFIPIQISDVAFFSFEDKLAFLYTNDQKRYMLDYTLENLEELIDPKLFFRLNRQFIVSFLAIKTVHNYFSRKLKVYVYPEVSGGIIVSKERAGQLKLWLDR